MSGQSARSRPRAARGVETREGSGAERSRLLDAFRSVRTETERRSAPLSDEDQCIQSMADASPAKWHRAHTTWFFEQFLLVPHLAGYRAFDARFGYLFNSYYVSAGPRHARPHRGLVTRPSAREVSAYRAHVDAAVTRLIHEADAGAFATIEPTVEIGLNHEQQHQELMLTDILHAFAQNPTNPVYDPAFAMPPPARPAEEARQMAGGIYRIGHDGSGFSFDNEHPAHQVLLRSVRIGPLVSNAEWLAFMADGGYGEPRLWLSDGWAAAREDGWAAPGYWREVDGEWWSMTLGGLRRLDPAAPVCHVSYYEADAFARWSGKDLPTEAEWEIAAGKGALEGAFGLVWQWTRSAYAAYPGYRPLPGALGEYNGKFMVNQLVLRGGSVVTPAGHERLTYRNFFYPHQRWQFMGLRLADYETGAAAEPARGGRP